MRISDFTAYYLLFYMERSCFNNFNFRKKIIKNKFVMKKLISLLAVILLAIGQLSAKDLVYRTTEPLPAAAKSSLKTNFPKTGVSHVKVDKHVFGGADYEVILVDGTEIEFNSDGEWKEVDCGQKAVPSGYVLKPISNYVSKYYKGQKIVKIDKGRNNYDVELSSGIDLKFDRSGKFLRIDD